MVKNNEAGGAAYDKTIISPTPLDQAAAAERLKEVKQIFDQLGVVFFLGSGTCLGATRENRFIPWDDEMDTASDLGRGEEAGLSYQLPGAIREPVNISGAKTLPVKPGGQLR